MKKTMTKTEMKAIAGSGGGWRKVRRRSMALFVKSGIGEISIDSNLTWLTVENVAQVWDDTNIVLYGGENWS